MSCSVAISSSAYRHGQRFTPGTTQRFGMIVSGGHFRSKRLSPKNTYPLKIAPAIKAFSSLSKNGERLYLLSLKYIQIDKYQRVHL
ncbi:hypothetical protein [Desulfosporosinus orientis]|uniref:hypothetical protein n=1 Tax=Desulfosporosinus orientis TaxID=1563 RepID=UPI0011D2C712|nr:hypothetical protein [Desulfosporosinus orientis]